MLDAYLFNFKNVSDFEQCYQQEKVLRSLDYFNIIRVIATKLVSEYMVEIKETCKYN